MTKIQSVLKKSDCCGVTLEYRKASRRENEHLLRCPACGDKWQCRFVDCVATYYQIRKSSDLVGYYCKITREQREWLKQRENASQTVRAAIDKIRLINI